MRYLCTLILAATFAIAVPTLAADRPVLQKTSSFLTTGGEDYRFKRTPQKAFTISDRIFLVTLVTWQPINKGAGRRSVVWKWYSKGTLTSEIKQRHNFRPTPFELWSTIPAAALGVGEHEVELLIDGEVFDAQEFSVSEPD